MAQNSNEADKSELTKQGIQFRKEIDEEYRKFSSVPRPRSAGRYSFDALVRTYLPEGSSFDDAKVILDAAGFKIGPRVKDPLSNDLEVFAEIDPYKRGLFSSTLIGIVLKPISQEDWSKVGWIESDIFINSLLILPGNQHHFTSPVQVAGALGERLDDAGGEPSLLTPGNHGA